VLTHARKGPARATSASPGWSARSCGWLLLLIAVTCLAIGCDQDPLGASRRTIRGDYQLKLWEDDTTYLLVDGSKSGADWVVAGAVARIGWDDRRIVVERRSPSTGKVEGFIVVDVPSKTASQLLSEREIAKKIDLSKIILVAPSEAWKLLSK